MQDDFSHINSSGSASENKLAAQRAEPGQDEGDGESEQSGEGEGEGDSLRCSICGNPRSDGNGSLTQWIVMCRCEDSAESLQGLSLGVCFRCGKRTRQGRLGSISQFIFQRDFCSCDSPESVSALLSGPNLATYEPVARVDEQELDVSPYLFPVDRFKPLSLIETDSEGASYLARDRVLDSVVLVSVAHTLDEEQGRAFLERAKELCKSEGELSTPRLLNVGVTIAAIPYIVTQVGLEKESEGGGESKVGLAGSEKVDDSVDCQLFDESLDRRVVPGETPADVIMAGYSSLASLAAGDQTNWKIRSKVFALSKVCAFAFGCLAVASLVVVWGRSVLKEPGVDHISAPVKKLDPEDSLSNSLTLYEGNKWTRLNMNGGIIYDAGPVNTDDDFAGLLQYDDVRTLRVMDSATITGTGLLRLRKFPIVSIQLDSHALSDDGLRALSEFATLRCVAIGWSGHITESGLNQLTKLLNLEMFSMNHMRLPKNTVSVIAKMPSLTEVQIAVPENFNRKEIAGLSALSRLKVLSLVASGIGDEDCAMLSRLPHLEQLGLLNNEITDRGVEKLARKPLVKLDLSGNQITDRSVEILAAKLPTLKELTIINCPRVSEDAKIAFLKARPKCWLADSNDGERRRGAD